jgi:hypothetical protein
MTQQMVMVSVMREVNGLEMGIFHDGTPYLTTKGLAQMCGVDKKSINDHTTQWKAGKRDSELAKMLVDKGFRSAEMTFDISTPGGPGYAYPDSVCSVILEYYAFVTPKPSLQAQSIVRKLMHAGLKAFIYSALGHDPLSRVPPAWRQFHDRVSLHRVPPGFFSVFGEMSGMVVGMIRAGAPIDNHTIPDISVGQRWATFWKDNNFDVVYSPRQEFPFKYPDYFPQAKGTEKTMNVYPLAALGEFRLWFENTYLPTWFPIYLKGKSDRGVLPPSVVELVLQEVTDGAVAALP